jgi:hypothetical protein
MQAPIRQPVKERARIRAPQEESVEWSSESAGAEPARTRAPLVLAQRKQHEEAEQEQTEPEA